MSKKAVAYIRYSDEKQRNNNSIIIQQKLITNKAIMHGYNFEDISWFIDEAESATHKKAEDRPKMQELVYEVKNNDFDAVFFFDESRVSRQVSDFVNGVYYPLKEEKPTLKFYSTTEIHEWDPDLPHIQAKLLFYKQESRVKRERAVAYQEMLLNSKDSPIRPGSPLPFGYQYEQTDENSKKVVIVNENGEADTVYLIFYLAAWGYSNSIIADFLNKCGIKSPAGKEWIPSSIDKILHNLFYVGKLTWNVRESRNNSKRKKDIEQIELFDDHHEPIIPNYLHELVKQVRFHKKNYGMNMDTPFLLKDIIRCKKCETILNAKNTTSGYSKKSRKVYRCPSCKNYCEIDTIHKIIFNKLFDLLERNEIAIKKEAQKMLKQWKKEISNKINKLISVVVFAEEQKRIYYNTKQTTNIKADIVAVIKNSSLKLKHLNHVENIITNFIDENQLELILNAFFEMKNVAFNQVEMRCLVTLFFEYADFNFNTKQASIKCRLSPFAFLENYIRQLTADSPDEVVE